MDNIQVQLLAAFEASGLTYDELAKKTNLPKSALYRYLNGDTEKIPIDRFQAICHELHVDAGVLLGWKVVPAGPAYAIQLTDDEHQLITAYRSLPDTGKQYMHQQLIAASLMFGGKSGSVPSVDTK